MWIFQKPLLCQHSRSFSYLSLRHSMRHIAHGSLESFVTHRWFWNSTYRFCVSRYFVWSLWKFPPEMFRFYFWRCGWRALLKGAYRCWCSLYNVLFSIVHHQYAARTTLYCEPTYTFLKIRCSQSPTAYCRWKYKRMQASSTGTQITSKRGSNGADVQATARVLLTSQQLPGYCVHRSECEYRCWSTACVCPTRIKSRAENAGENYQERCETEGTLLFSFSRSLRFLLFFEFSPLDFDPLKNVQWMRTEKKTLTQNERRYSQPCKTTLHLASSGDNDLVVQGSAFSHFELCVDELLL